MNPIRVLHIFGMFIVAIHAERSIKIRSMVTRLQVSVDTTRTGREYVSAITTGNIPSHINRTTNRMLFKRKVQISSSTHGTAGIKHDTPAKRNALGTPELELHQVLPVLFLLIFPRGPTKDKRGNVHCECRNHSCD